MERNREVGILTSLLRDAFRELHVLVEPYPLVAPPFELCRELEAKFNQRAGFVEVHFDMLGFTQHPIEPRLTLKDETMYPYPVNSVVVHPPTTEFLDLLHQLVLHSPSAVSTILSELDELVAETRVYQERRRAEIRRLLDRYSEFVKRVTAEATLLRLTGGE